MERILIGSRAFFGGYDDFCNDYNRYLEMVDNIKSPLREEMLLRGVYTVKYKKESGKKLISKSLETGDPVSIAKFLVPEVAKAIKVKVSDLQPLECLLPKLDKKHQYIATLYQAVKENGGFDITQEQRDAAYEVYKAARVANENKEEE